MKRLMMSVLLISGSAWAEGPAVGVESLSRAMQDQPPAAVTDCLFDQNCGQASASDAVDAAASSAAGAPSLASSRVTPVGGSSFAAAGVPALGLAADERGATANTDRRGAAEGASAGFEFGMGVVLYPAVSLMSDGFGRSMSSAYDGPNSDNRFAGAYSTLGVILAIFLYVPALVVGAVTGIAGAVSEAVSPGSTSGWVEKLFD